LDANGDGLIDYSEYMASARDAASGDGVVDQDAVDWFKDVFHASDVDRDGALDMEEAAIMDRIARSAFTRATDFVVETLSEVYDIHGGNIDIGAVGKLIRHVRAGIDGRTAIEEVVASARRLVATRKEYKGMDEPVLAWLARLLRASDLDEDGLLDHDEAGLMLMLARSALSSRSVESGMGNDAQDEYDDDREDEDEDRMEVDELTEAFLEFDENLDGRIDRGEFMNAAFDSNPTGSGLRRAKELFVKADRNADLSLDRPELAELLRELND